MGSFDELRSMGANADEALERVMGNAALYERMLGQFADMLAKSSVTPDFDDERYADMIEAAHAIKGAAGNLAVTPMYEAYTEIVRLLRADEPEKAREIIKKIQPAQAEIISCLKRYGKGKVWK